MFNLKEFRKRIGLRQVDMAEILNCTQPNIVAMERDLKELTEEQFNILSNTYGADLVHEYYIEKQDCNIKEEKQFALTNSDNDLSALVIEQQKSISSLINIVRTLQEENIRLTAEIMQKRAI